VIDLVSMLTKGQVKRINKVTCTTGPKAIARVARVFSEPRGKAWLLLCGETVLQTDRGTARASQLLSTTAVAESILDHMNPV